MRVQVLCLRNYKVISFDSFKFISYNNENCLICDVGNSVQHVFEAGRFLQIKHGFLDWIKLQ